MFGLFKIKGDFNLGDLIISIVIHLGGGWLVGIIVGNSKELYETLEKPIFSPPSIVFPIVWSILYVMMTIAAYRIYELKKKENVKGALGFYVIQLVLNFLWSIIFFKFRLYGLAFIELIILLIFILISIWKFIRVDKIAGYLLIPYALWCTFAGVLNFFIWMLNEM